MSTTTPGSERTNEEGFVTLDNVEVVYNRQFLAVNGFSMSVSDGNIVALMGPNGAGKSTVLKMISGIGRTERGEVTRGSVRFQGQDVTNADPNKMVANGVTHILEGRRVFPDLTVEENLRCGLYRQGNRLRYDPADYELAFEYFPQLEDILDIKAGYASGGEQQMIVISRALLHEPRLLLLDEPSLGLAPQLVDEVFEVIESLVDEGVTVFLVEQQAKRALQTADRAYVMRGGEIEFEGEADEIIDRDDLSEAYLQ